MCGTSLYFLSLHCPGKLHRYDRKAPYWPTLLSLIELRRFFCYQDCYLALHSAPKLRSYVQEPLLSVPDCLAELHNFDQQLLQPDIVLLSKTTYIFLLVPLATCSSFLKQTMYILARWLALCSPWIWHRLAQHFPDTLPNLPPENYAILSPS